MGAVRHWVRAAGTLAAGLAIAAAQAGAQTWVTSLSGPNESPPNASPGTGTATVNIASHIFTIDVVFDGLLGNTTASHIHCCTAVPFVSTAGIATVTPNFTGFPLGVTSGTYHHAYDLSLTSSYSPAFLAANGGSVANAEAAFINGLNTGRAYLNVHSTVVPGGEIRGFFAAPEPSTYALMATGLVSLGMFSRRRRRS